jgi:hypothetical protein
MDPRTLSNLTLAALRRLAAERRLPGRSRMDRTALVAALSATVSPKATAAAPRAATKVARPAAKPRPAPRRNAPGPVARLPVAREPVAREPVAPARLPHEVEVRALAEGGIPPRAEPSDSAVVFDHGAILPDRYPGTRVRVMVRDPQSLFVYWEVPADAGGEAWEIASLDADDRTLQAFRVGHEGTSGYLNVASASVERVTLRPVHRGLPAEPWATVDLTASLPEPPLVQGPAPWVELPAAFPDREPPRRAALPGHRTDAGTRRATLRAETTTEPAAPEASIASDPRSEATSSTLPAGRRRT